MAQKSLLNDYSGFNSIFRDTTLGIALSAGGLGTLLPNMLHGFSEIRDLDTFESLSIFSVSYFVLPIIIITSYWFTRGYRLYIMEKLSGPMVKDLEEWLATHRADEHWTMAKLGIGVGLKLMLVVVFLFSPDSLDRWIIVIGYFVIVILEIAVIDRRTGEIVDALAEKHKAQKDMLNAIRGGSLHFSFLIFFLDLSIGLCMIIFQKPWIVYKDEFYVSHALVIIAYAAIYVAWCFWLGRKTPLSHWRIIGVLIPIVLSALCIPAVNLSGFDKISIVTMIVSCGAILAFAYWSFYKKNNGYWKFAAYTVIVFGAAFAFVRYPVWYGFERLNKTYFENRIRAAESFSDKELFPLFALADSLMPTDKEFKNNIMRTVSEVETINESVESLPVEKQSTLKIELTSLHSVAYPELRKKYNVRDIYFGEYKDKRWDTARYYRQAGLNIFYGGVNQHVEANVFKRFFLPADTLLLRDTIPSLKNYYHPLDYFALSLRRYITAKDSAKTMLRICTRLQTLQQLRDSKPASATDEIFQATQQQSMSDLKHHYAANTELAPLIESLDTVDNSAEYKKLRDFHNDFLYFREIKYAERYQKAQVVYRSYLTDSQRIGVYVFVSTLVIIVLCAIYGARDNRYFAIKTSDGAEKPTLPTDASGKAFYIQALVVFILILPLLKPIKPQNIDPEKPYWMMSIQNWYAPTYTARIASPTLSSGGNIGNTTVKLEDKAILDSLHMLAGRIDQLVVTMRDQSTYNGPEDKVAPNK
jgi:hypothetical protein